MSAPRLKLTVMKSIEQRLADEVEQDRKDAARYRFLRDDGHLEYLGPDSNKKLPAKAIDKVVDRWMRMQGKAADRRVLRLDQQKGVKV